MIGTIDSSADTSAMTAAATTSFRWGVALDLAQGHPGDDRRE